MIIFHLSWESLLLFFILVPILVFGFFPIIFGKNFKFKFPIVLQFLHIATSVSFFLFGYSSLMFEYTHDMYGCGNKGHFFDVWAMNFVELSLIFGIILLLDLIFELILYINKKRKGGFNHERRTHSIL